MHNTTISCFFEIKFNEKNICFKRLGLKKIEKFINLVLYECYLMIVKFKRIYHRDYFENLI